MCWRCASSTCWDCEKESRLTNNNERVRARAEAIFKKSEQKALEGATARAEYEAERIFVREKTARLMSLRLSKAAQKAIITPNYRAIGISAGHEGLGDPRSPMGRKVKARR
jgi:hypothetical protein